jgi:hypothetical protein
LSVAAALPNVEAEANPDSFVADPAAGRLVPHDGEGAGLVDPPTALSIFSSRSA